MVFDLLILETCVVFTETFDGESFDLNRQPPP